MNASFGPGAPQSQRVPVRWLLWDIDGTLVRFAGTSTDKHAAAVEAVVGIPVGRDQRTAGMTDREIIVTVMGAGGDLGSDGVIDGALRVLEDLSEREMTSDSVLALEGVSAALSAATQAGWTNGLLTGNTPRRARTKLTAAHLWDALSPGGGFFGDRHGDRFSLAEQGALVVLHNPGTRIVLVGDTPLDIQAGHAAGLPVVAVATGNFSVAELGPFEPELLLTDLVTGARDFQEFLAGQG